MMDIEGAEDEKFTCLNIWGYYVNLISYNILQSSVMNEMHAQSVLTARGNL